MRTTSILAALLLGACGTTGAGPGAGGSGAGGSGGPCDAYDPAACDADLAGFTACGGDPTGDWTVVAACVDGDFEASFREHLAEYPFCADAPVDVALDVVGASRYGSDGTYQSSMLVALRVTLLFDDLCLRSLAPAATSPESCAKFDGQPAGEATFRCSYGNGGCTCVAKQSVTTDGTKESSFCVRDDLLFLFSDRPSGQIRKGMFVLRRDRG